VGCGASPGCYPTLGKTLNLSFDHLQYPVWREPTPQMGRPVWETFGRFTKSGSWV